MNSDYAQLVVTFLKRILFELIVTDSKSFGKGFQIFLDRQT